MRRMTDERPDYMTDEEPEYTADELGDHDDLLAEGRLGHVEHIGARWRTGFVRYEPDGHSMTVRLVAEGTPSGVKAAQGGHLLEVITDKPQVAADYLKQTRDRWRISLFGDRLHVVVDSDPNSEILRLTNELGALEIKVLQAYETPYSLEDVFISIVEKQQALNRRK